MNAGAADVDDVADAGTVAAAIALPFDPAIAAAATATATVDSAIIAATQLDHEGLHPDPQCQAIPQKVLVSGMAAVATPAVVMPTSARFYRASAGAVAVVAAVVAACPVACAAVKALA